MSYETVPGKETDPSRDQKYESPLMTFEEFLAYLKIGRTKGRELTRNPNYRFVVRIGRKVMVHKELLDDYLKKAAKYGLDI
ncbi:excisionase [Fusibacillus kribbianus]|uniref:Excisionase n=1 Tax=Fusibacillus kribbianus TaxID=3044208 RepID=A0AAP4EXK2_9FIRM|nr:excisionase [Ruminococcus sp. YH-rum2234]MDI9241902.1 excisionase [Ruminococcus sp. YH-rum2234]